MATQLTLSQAFDGMILEKRADGKSIHTISDYRVTLKKLQLFLAETALGGDPPLQSITRDRLIAFFVWLRDEHVSEPDGIAPRGRIRLGDKSRRNIHVNLSALWTWAVAAGYLDRNIVRTIAAPPLRESVIEPLTRDEIVALIKACDVTRSWKISRTTSARPTAMRDRLIIHLLLDTGIRAQELCDIALGDLNLTANSIRIHGKGRKERTVHIGKRTAKSTWAYLAPRLNSSKPSDNLIRVGQPDDPRPMTRNGLGILLRRLGQRAGVTNVHPHRFRHTFAITYLRNGGKMFALQELLGHSDLEMVKRYTRLVEADIAADHESASPVDGWRL